MSTNGINPCDDAEMADCDGDKVVTMMDVLKEQEDFEDDANAVLGASDDKNCTYSKGYVKRQAIYACMTCTDAKNEPSKRAGVCLACSLSCHENHELIELYTKRNFRCDCGNPKFNSHPCQFTPDKIELNIENIYNQNFSGVYCTCHRPYPDPEGITDGDMIQCIICEDWLHCNHLDAVVPPNEQYSEMICKACMDKNEFLHDYSHLVVSKEIMDVDVLNTSSEETNFNENTPIDITDNKDVNSNSDDNANAKTENDDSAKQANEENKINTEDQNNTGLESEESKKKEGPHESDQMNLEKNDLEVNKNSEIEAHTEDVKLMTDATNDSGEKERSLKEQGDTPIGETDKTDNRSQEQVEEDLLLADPVDTESDQKKEDMNVVPSNDNESNSNGSSSNKSETNMKTSGDKSKIVTTAGVTKNVIASQNIGNVTTNEEPMTAPDSEQSDVTATATEDMQAQRTGNTNIGNSEDIPTSEQPEILPVSEQPDNVPHTDEPKQVSADEQSNQRNEKEVSVNENNLNNDKYNEESNCGERENPEDIEMVGNNVDKIVSNNIPEGNMENNSNCDIEQSDKIIETDILKRKLSSDGTVENIETKKPKLEENQCVRPKNVKKVHHGATFWPSNFRHKLCTCNECLSMYKDLSVLFLIDPDDTVTAYEQLGKEKTDGKPASQYEKGMAALSSLGRVQQINALTEYTKLRDKLLDFLKTFKDKKVIVKEEDIKAFFAGMKPVREPDGVYFCR